MRKLFVFFIFLISLSLIVEVSPVSAVASIDKNFNQGLNRSGVEAGYPTEAVDKNPGNFILKLLGTFMAPMMMGVIGLVILIYAGYNWMMARGDEEKVKKAKDIIINTILAWVVIFSIYAIVKLIIPLWTHVTQ